MHSKSEIFSVEIPQTEDEIQVFQTMMDDYHERLNVYLSDLR